MNKSFIESVPNFSEGRNKETIYAIAKEIDMVAGAQLLNVDSNFSANRTVYTIAGETNAVILAVEKMVHKAAALINMEKHSGKHPRIGAADVIPFIPLKGITIPELDERIQQFSRKISKDLALPIYMYESSARIENRRNLANIRKGEYEGLAEKVSNEDWVPDYGPNQLNPKLGATVIGVRDFLIAYNINIREANHEKAKLIAKELRSSNKYTYAKDGSRTLAQNKLTKVKAISWYIDEFETFQISTNLIDFRLSGMHDVYEKCKEIAEKHNVNVSGSELIGLLPQQALLDAGKFYLGNGSEADYIEAAIQNLNLSEVKEFIPQERILEYMMDLEH